MDPVGEFECSGHAKHVRLSAAYVPASHCMGIGVVVVPGAVVEGEFGADVELSEALVVLVFESEVVDEPMKAGGEEEKVMTVVVGAELELVRCVS